VNNKIKEINDMIFKMNMINKKLDRNNMNGLNIMNNHVINDLTHEIHNMFEEKKITMIVNDNKKNYGVNNLNNINIIQQNQINIFNTINNKIVNEVNEINKNHWINENLKNNTTNNDLKNQIQMKIFSQKNKKR